MPAHLFILLVKRSLTGAYRQPIRKFKNNSAYRGFMEEMGRPLYTFKGDGGYIGIGMSMAASEAHQAAENNEQNGGIVSASEITLKPRRQWCLTLVDRRGDTAQLRFFHFYSAQVKQFEAGVRLRALGEIRKAFSGPEMVHPTMRIITENTPLPNTLTPVYPASQGVGQAWLRRAIDQALADTPLPEILPETLQAEIIVPLRLPSLAD